jgi:hypothetical protein
MPAFAVPDNLPPLHSKSVDTLSVMYLQSLGLDIGTPLRVNADGNCLFKSISTLLYGHEDRARELRVRICIQMCNNMDRYLTSPDAGNILCSLQLSRTTAEIALQIQHGHHPGVLWL